MEKSLLHRTSQFFYDIIKYYTFWVILSMVDRFIHIIYFYQKMKGINLADFCQLLLRGGRMDASMAGYITCFPFLLFTIAYIFPGLHLRNVLKAYTWLVLFFFALVSVIDINIYREWGEKMSYKVIRLFLDSPREAIISSSSSPLLLSAAIGLFIYSVGFLLYTRLSEQLLHVRGRMQWFTYIPAFFLGAFLLFYVIRSGLKTSPLNPSMAYFSSRPVYNHLAVNTQWYLLDDVLRSSKGRQDNFYHVMDDTVARALLAPLFKKQYQPAYSFLTTDRPNVVFIIMESFTADLIERLGGEKGISPHFETLIDQGLFFNHIYAASDRSDKGIIAILSAFPAQGKKSIILNVNKHEHLPGLGQELKQQHYSTSFYYGGVSEFYNFKSYMLAHGYDRVTDQFSFARAEAQSNWGVYDGLVFRRQLQDLRHEKQPFFSTLFTISNHEPFQLPGHHQYGNKTNSDAFKSTAYYTDSVLYDYLEQAKKESWYQNTLFVMVADHGHRLPLEKWESYHPNRYRIPLLLFGAAIKPAYRGTVVEKIGNQTDLVATLLDQMHLSSARYPWSRDLLDTTVAPFAFFDWQNGFGVVTPQQQLTYDQEGKMMAYKKNEGLPEAEDQTLLTKAKAYMQLIYNDYLHY
ncbi:Phosphoglycerol transferase MdoB [bacterium A37T11]|nr:Phosphoglycerol transferase MdoB [bacterium A37T11]